MEVYKSIAAIIGEMATQGIVKNSKNKQQGWQFRGIDAVYNTLAPLLAKYELMILPRIKNRTVCEKQTKSGGNLFYVTVDAEFDFVSAKDGSKHTVATIGEAMDSGDKATNKAMSIALKYAAFQSFFIPTEETTVDPDNEAYNIKPTMTVKDLEGAINASGWTNEQVCNTYNPPLKSINEIQDIASCISFLKANEVK